MERFEIKKLPWFLNILGFYYEHDLKVLSEPRFEGENLVYGVEVIEARLKWLVFTLKRIKNVYKEYRWEKLYKLGDNEIN